MEEGEAEFILRSADNYAILAALHAEENAKTFPELEADKARRRWASISLPSWTHAAARACCGSPCHALSPCHMQIQRTNALHCLCSHTLIICGEANQLLLHGDVQTLRLPSLVVAVLP